MTRSLKATLVALAALSLAATLAREDPGYYEDYWPVPQVTSVEVGMRDLRRPVVPQRTAVAQREEAPTLEAEMRDLRRKFVDDKAVFAGTERQEAPSVEVEMRDLRRMLVAEAVARTQQTAAALALEGETRHLRHELNPRNQYYRVGTVRPALD